MTPAEARQTFVDVGILNPDGTLAEAYGGEPLECAAATAGLRDDDG